jgi:glycosyltransferase involved in cell wall biosynthesis
VHAYFFTPAFPPFIGGGERYARSLALALADHGLEITVITSLAQREEQFWKGTGTTMHIESDGPLMVARCALRSMPGGRNGLLAWRKAMTLLSGLPGDQTRLLQAMARRIPGIENIERALDALPSAPNVVHGFNLSWERTALAAAAFARQQNVPFVLTPFMHFGSIADGIPQRSVNARLRRMARNNTMDHQRRLLAGAQAVLALTSVECEAFSRWEIDTQRLVVIGGGVDRPPSLHDAASLAANHGLRAPFALFVGRVNRDKGAIDAAQATLQLAQAGQPLTLVLVGQTAQDFDRFYARLNEEQRSHVRSLGPVDEVTKHALLQQAAMLVLPSQAESFGIVILEAWQHATPVVASRAGGIPGVVDEGKNGLLAPYGDVEALAGSMARLLGDETLRHKMGRQGQQKVKQQYSWDVVADRVLAVYRQVTS